MNSAFKKGDVLVPKRMSVRAIGGVPPDQIINSSKKLTVSSYEYWPPKSCFTLTFVDVPGRYWDMDFQYPD